MKKSWRTTTAGIIAIIVAVVGAIGAVIDDDPKTNPDYGAVGAAIMAGLGLITARDNNVTSEDAGAKPPPK